MPELLITPDGGRITRHHIVAYKLMPRDFKPKATSPANPAIRHVYFWLSNDESGRPADVPAEHSETVMKLLDRFVCSGSPQVFNMAKIINDLASGEYFVAADASDPPFDDPHPVK